MSQNSKSVTVGWFEIPVSDMDRAIQFYNEVFDMKISKQDFVGAEMAFFPWNENDKGAGGSLIHADEHYTPNHQGTLVYFSSTDVNTELKKVPGAGGKIIQKKTEISPDIGYMALFEDSEGNRLALHSRS